MEDINKTKTVEVKDCLGDKCKTCNDTDCFWYYLTSRFLGRKIKNDNMV